MCQVLGVSRSAYYQWKSREPTKRDIENQRLVEQIRNIYLKSKKTYGSPRVTMELARQEITASRPRVARIMKKQNLVSIRRKKFRSTTDSKHNYPVVENKLNRDFSVKETGRVWVSDITYVRTRQGWLYLTVILDLADRKVVGWAMSNSLKAYDTSIAAWKMATKRRPITQELIFHSDRGIQYACTEFRELLEKYPLVSRSMSRKGDCWDNAVAESFFNNIKIEWIYHRSYKTREQARVSIFEYIETWYNQNRIHTTIKMPIREFKNQPQNQKLVA